MIRNLIVVGMLTLPLLALVPTSSAWVCRPDPQQICETVQDEASYEYRCLTGGDGAYPTADCAAHGYLPGVLVCTPSPVAQYIC
jgi:hypothetical protein